MKPEKFAERYLQNEQAIRKELRRLQIYDEDRLHDTYIALYDHSRHAEIADYVKTFVAFYRTLQRRTNDHAAHYIPCSPGEMVAHYDQADETDIEYREEVAKRVDEIIEEYKNHPFQGERQHERAVRILELYRTGLTQEEIGQRLKMSRQAVNQLYERTIKNLRIRYRESAP